MAVICGDAVDAITLLCPPGRETGEVYHGGMLRRCVLLAASLILAGACGGSSDPAPTPAVTPPDGAIELRYDGGSLRVELAVTPEERARGLSNRASLSADAGMLFVFESARQPSFWMKDTLIPLDLVWIDADKRVEGVTPNVQPEPGVADGALRRYSPETSVLYVLELNAAAAARLGIVPGSQLEFDAASR